MSEEGEFKKRIREQSEPSAEMLLRGVKPNECAKTVVQFGIINKIVEDAKKEIFASLPVPRNPILVKMIKEIDKEEPNDSSYVKLCMVLWKWFGEVI